MDKKNYGKIVDFIHFLIKNSFLERKNVVAIDGTAGNGYDTAFLCEIFKDSGFVYAFDIQDIAMRNTKKLLEEKSFSNYKLILDSHSNIKKYVIEDKIDVAVFNLGYLPNGDKSIITNYKTSLDAISQCVSKLSIDGKIFIAAYLLQDNGEEERAIKEYMMKLNSQEYNSIEVNIINKKNGPPNLFIIEKCK